MEPPPSRSELRQNGPTTEATVQTLTRRVTTDRPLVERLVAFWSNHLCISTGAKVTVAPLAGSYEREAIRPHFRSGDPSERKADATPVTLADRAAEEAMRRILIDAARRAAST